MSMNDTATLGYRMNRAAVSGTLFLLVLAATCIAWNPIQEYHEDMENGGGGPGPLLEIVILCAVLAIVSFPVMYLVAISKTVASPGPPSLLSRAYRLTADHFWPFIGFMVMTVYFGISILLAVPTVVVYGLYHTFQGKLVDGEGLAPVILAEYVIVGAVLFVVGMVRTGRSMK